jgi:hypothetical protein
MSFEEVMARKRERQAREASSGGSHGHRDGSPGRRSPPPSYRRDREDMRYGGAMQRDDASALSGRRSPPASRASEDSSSDRGHGRDRSMSQGCRERDERARGDERGHHHQRDDDRGRDRHNDRYTGGHNGAHRDQRTAKELAEPPADPKLRPLDDDPRSGKLYRQTTHGRKGEC